MIKIFKGLKQRCQRQFLALPRLDDKVFPGDQSKFSLICLCCGKKITPTELIGKLLFMAPMAICHHLKILSSIPPVNDVPLIFKNMPVLFTSTKKYSTSKKLFDNAIYEIAEDDADELFHSKNSCTNHDCRIGECLLVGQGRYSVPISSTLKILITPPY